MGSAWHHMPCLQSVCGGRVCLPSRLLCACLRCGPMVKWLCVYSGGCACTVGLCRGRASTCVSMVLAVDVLRCAGCCFSCTTATQPGFCLEGRQRAPVLCWLLASSAARQCVHKLRACSKLAVIDRSVWGSHTDGGTLPVRQTFSICRSLWGCTVQSQLVWCCRVVSRPPEGSVVCLPPSC